jgi:hypothetical protein
MFVQGPGFNFSLKVKACYAMKNWGAGVTFDLTFFDNSKVIDFDN